MTTSIVFDEIDYSQIEYEEDSIDENMLTDPSASIIALQNLRILKTRETGDIAVTPDTTGRTSVPMINYNGTSYKEYKMKRKAEILKYKNNTSLNKKTQYSALASSRRGKLSNIVNVASNCESDVIRVKKATNSGIKGDNSLLFNNPNVAFIERL